MKRLFVIVPLCIIIVALLACGASDTNTGTTTGNNTPAATPAAHFKVTDKVTVGTTWKVVVNSFAVATPGAYDPAAKGQYVAANVSLTNISNAEQDLSSLLSFKFKGSDGTAYTETILSSTTTSPNGKIAAGDIVKGDLVYDVPVDQKSFTLSFAPDITSSGQTIWDLNL